MNTILEEINEDKTIEGQFQIIKLNGYLHETDELVVRHIVKALNKDLVAENEFRGSALGNALSVWKCALLNA